MDNIFARCFLVGRNICRVTRHRCYGGSPLIELIGEVIIRGLLRLLIGLRYLLTVLEILGRNDLCGSIIIHKVYCKFRCIKCHFIITVVVTGLVGITVGIRIIIIIILCLYRPIARQIPADTCALVSLFDTLILVYSVVGQIRIVRNRLACCTVVVRNIVNCNRRQIIEIIFFNIILIGIQQLAEGYKPTVHCIECILPFNTVPLTIIRYMNCCQQRLRVNQRCYDLTTVIAVEIVNTFKVSKLGCDRCQRVG